MVCLVVTAFTYTGGVVYNSNDSKRERKGQTERDEGKEGRQMGGGRERE